MNHRTPFPKHIKNLSIVAAAGLLHHLSAVAVALSVSSTPAQVGLLELYTSEGCSSCPPADRWLSELEDDPRLWRELVPVAFHVDYWDYIGWKDRFADPAYSQRQRDYAREQSLRTVYTPGFVYNGREWRRWFARGDLDLPRGGQPGVLQLRLEDGTADLLFTPAETLDNGVQLSVTVALLGSGLSTRVEAGENTGRELRHSFVVLGLSQAPMTQDGGEFSATVAMPESTAVPQRYAVAAWVHAPPRQRPIQAVGGWLP